MGGDALTGGGGDRHLHTATGAGAATAPPPGVGGGGLFAVDVERKLANVLRLCAARYLSKGYAQFSASPLADPATEEVRRKLRALHPLPARDMSGVGRGEVTTPPVPEPIDFVDAPGVHAAVTSFEAFAARSFAGSLREAATGARHVAGHE